MTTVTECVICGGEIRTRRQALVAPFLAKRIWNRSPFQVALVECKSCGFLFYNPRLDAAEEGRLYANYRSCEYREMRHAAEPWYTDKFNASLAATELYELRKKTLTSLLSPHLSGRSVRRILDYGGDGGELVRGLAPGAEAFVYDISNAPTVEGVRATSNPKGCGADLIINSNVLEHVGFPRTLVGEIADCCPAGGMIFLEVPSESPFGTSRIARRAAQVGWTCMARPALAGAMLKPSSLYMMHEHINYYTERSLGELVRRSDCKLVSSGLYTADSPFGKVTMAWALASR